MSTQRSSAVTKLTKPSLVDLLRLCDKHRWCAPRIRYASIRSKPDLCHDLVKFFSFTEEGDFVYIKPLRPILNFPDLKYHLKSRRFWKDGVLFDAATVSRQKPQFHLERKTVTLQFSPVAVAPGNGTIAAAFQAFLAPS